MAGEAVFAPQIRPRELTAHRPPLLALTGIRFFAAMYVVLFHSHLPDVFARHHWFAAAQMIENGMLAVPLFFMLSGFILSYTYRGQLGLPSSDRRFWEARFARVWPLYALSLLLSTLVNHTTPHSIPTALATIFMVQSWNPFSFGMSYSWNFVCWTLSVEAFFYLLFPFLQRWLERREPRQLLAIFSVAVAITVAGKTGGINAVDNRGLQHIPLALLHLPEFIIGVCIGNLFLMDHYRNRVKEFSWHGLATILVALITVWLLCHPLLGAAAWTSLGFAVLLFLLAAEESPIQRLLSSRVLLIGGQISFGIYLLQWPCKMFMNSVCNLAHIESTPGRFIITTLALILLSSATFYGVEEPARRVIRKMFARREEELLHQRAGSHQ